MKGFFREDMTSSEARSVLFSAVEGKRQDEIERIKQEYEAVIPRITERELREYDGCLTSDVL